MSGVTSSTFIWHIHEPLKVWQKLLNACPSLTPLADILFYWLSTSWFYWAVWKKNVLGIIERGFCVKAGGTALVPGCWDIRHQMLMDVCQQKVHRSRQLCQAGAITVITVLSFAFSLSPHMSVDGGNLHRLVNFWIPTAISDQNCDQFELHY